MQQTSLHAPSRKSDSTGKSGNRSVLDEYFENIYPELVKLATRRMRGERPDHTLQATAVVNEVYFRLEKMVGFDWQGPEHVLAMAAETIRRVLVDSARTHDRQKRGGNRQRVPLDTKIAMESGRIVDLVALNDAMERLAAIEPMEARIVDCRFWAGMTETQIASALGIGERTVRRHWTHAKLWLYRELG